MPTSPNVNNYHIGKGIVSFKETGASVFTDLGNAPSFVYTPTIEKLEHFSSREGVKTKDFTAITQAGATIAFTLDEITGLNLSFFSLAEQGTDTDGNITLSGLSKTEFTVRTSMADLLDIAPSTSVEVVRIGGRRIKVQGLHGDAIASLAARFPALVTLIAGGDDIVPRLIAQFGNGIGPIIAAGCGHLGDERYEQRASTLSVEDQFKLITAIYGLTFPNGLAAFIEAMAGLMTGAAGEEPKIVRIRLKKSPSASPLSSDAASRPTMQ
jgi:hypothetical protein